MSANPDGAAHLSVAQLSAHLDRRLGGAERASVVSHLAECDECRREYRETGQLVSRRSPARVASGLRLLAAATLAFVFLPHGPPGQPLPERDNAVERVAQPDAAPAVRIATPRDGQRLTSGRTFVWHGEARNALFRLTVQAADGSVLWRTSGPDTTATVPDSVRFAPNTVYYWSVEALHADGRPARSRATPFLP
ncbi:MAG TPA: zf-HC2 domain-containing protein [Gemmatimonadaceae bacterium]|nr:zf-HC2 domain-containing protein [Gemmatimonadaceae bacterium]